MINVSIRNSNRRKICGAFSAICLFLLVSGFLPSLSWANTELINVQGKLTDNAGNPLSGNYGITFRMYANLTDPTTSAIWTEIKSVTVSTGLFNVTLGTTTSFDTTPFNASYYLGMQVAGDSNELSPRQLLGASAYALGSLGNFDVKNTLTVSTITVTNRLKWTNKTNLMLWTDGTPLLQLPEANSAFFGYNSGILLSGGVFNTAYGTEAMPFPWSGNFNNAMGNSAMSGNLLTGENNNAMGYASLGNLSSGFYNNAVGGSSLNQLTTGTGNTGVGAYSLFHLVSTNYSTAVGYRSMFWSTGTANTSLGYEAGTSSDTNNASTSDDHVIWIGVETGRDLPSAVTLTNAGAMGYRAYVHKSNEFQMGGEQGSGTEWTVLMSTLVVNNHYNNTGKVAPVVSSCGTSPSIVGYDSAGTITVGSGATTACTLTFGTAWANTPTCVMTLNTSAVTGGVTSLSTTTITFSFSSSMGSGKIYYMCMGRDS